MQNENHERRFLQRKHLYRKSNGAHVFTAIPGDTQMRIIPVRKHLGRQSESFPMGKDLYKEFLEIHNLEERTPK